MRYTAENTDVREVPAGEVWVGTVPDPAPHVVIATRSDDEDDLILVCRFKPYEAFRFGEELMRLALAVEASNN